MRRPSLRGGAAGPGLAALGARRVQWGGRCVPAFHQTPVVAGAGRDRAAHRCGDGGSASATAIASAWVFPAVAARRSLSTSRRLPSVSSGRSPRCSAAAGGPGCRSAPSRRPTRLGPVDGPHEPESTTPAVTVAAVPGNVPTHNAAFGRIEMTGSCRGPGFVPSNTGRAAVVAAGSGVQCCERRRRHRHRPQCDVPCPHPRRGPAAEYGTDLDDPARRRSRGARRRGHGGTVSATTAWSRRPLNTKQGSFYSPVRISFRYLH